MPVGGVDLRVLCLGLLTEPLVERLVGVQATQFASTSPAFPVLESAVFEPVVVFVSPSGVFSAVRHFSCPVEASCYAAFLSSLGFGLFEVVAELPF